MVLLSTVIYLDMAQSVSLMKRENVNSFFFLSWKWNFNQNLTLHNQQKPLWVLKYVKYPINYLIHKHAFFCVSVRSQDVKYFSNILIYDIMDCVQKSTKDCRKIFLSLILCYGDGKVGSFSHKMHTKMDILTDMSIIAAIKDNTACVKL